MGKSSQTSADHDGSSDRITARVGSRTKKAKVVFDPSDHHVPRKRNRRGENDLPSVTTPKSEPNRTATPSSSSSTDGGSNNVSASSGGQGATPAGSYRFCMVCGKNGPGRMPRKSTIAPWTCPGCLWEKESGDKGSKYHNKHQDQSSMQHNSSNRVVEEEDNKQQHDFAGFSETELSGHGNDDTQENDNLSIPIKSEHESDEDSRRFSDQMASKDHTQENPEESIVTHEKEIRYWSCDDVCRYFSQHCQDWGDLFQEQEIDGPSLLLMQKGDVLSRFGLKLGPAMELYQRIVALQNGDHDIVDVRLTWI